MRRAQRGVPDQEMLPSSRLTDIHRDVAPSCRVRHAAQLSNASVHLVSSPPVPASSVVPPYATGRNIHRLLHTLLVANPHPSGLRLPPLPPLLLPHSTPDCLPSPPHRFLQTPQRSSPPHPCATCAPPLPPPTHDTPRQVSASPSVASAPAATSSPADRRVVHDCDAHGGRLGA